MFRQRGTEVDRTYQQYQALLTDIANKFSKRYGLEHEFDDLRGEADVAFMIAYDTYKPTHSKFTTYLSTVVWDRLLKYQKKLRRMHQLITADWVPDCDELVPEDGVWSLSDDAQDIVRLISHMPLELFRKCHTKHYRLKSNYPAYLQRQVKYYLVSMGWTTKRVLECFDEILGVLAE